MYKGLSVGYQDVKVSYDTATDNVRHLTHVLPIMDGLKRFYYDLRHAIIIQLMRTKTDGIMCF